MKGEREDRADGAGDEKKNEDLFQIGCVSALGVRNEEYVDDRKSEIGGGDRNARMI